ncbi:hypothetical protein E2C01_058106 [Portunus trituberculatus]|uniref:Uncharacterized protein n=1 Tax=Portunus trituberculatus TaxID=210409 RepID=A0A5B7H3T6_PORTR|nr:hypothetical protein [Portunus trituberculatus]
MDRIRSRALGDPSDPKARMVPLYHGGPLSVGLVSGTSLKTRHDHTPIYYSSRVVPFPVAHQGKPPLCSPSRNQLS